MSDNSYFISVNQVLASARLSQMKLFHSLHIPASDQTPSSCPTRVKNDDEKVPLHLPFLMMRNLFFYVVVCFYIVVEIFFPMKINL